MVKGCGAKLKDTDAGWIYRDTGALWKLDFFNWFPHDDYRCGTEDSVDESGVSKPLIMLCKECLVKVGGIW